MVSIRRRLGQFDRRRVANRFALAVLAVIIFLFVAGAVPHFVGADNSYVVQSDSMSPAIDAGDVVFVYDTAPDYIAKGDVITFEQAGAGDSLASPTASSTSSKKTANGASGPRATPTRTLTRRSSRRQR